MHLAWDSGTRFSVCELVLYGFRYTECGFYFNLLLIFLLPYAVQMWVPRIAAHGCIPSTA